MKKNEFMQIVATCMEQPSNKIHISSEDGWIPCDVTLVNGYIYRATVNNGQAVAKLDYNGKTALQRTVDTLWRYVKKTESFTLITPNGERELISVNY